MNAHNTGAASVVENMVEANFAADCLAPASISDAGRVRQGGLHHLLPWLIGTILGA
jgi:hypothetical protein